MKRWVSSSPESIPARPLMMRTASLCIGLAEQITIGLASARAYEQERQREIEKLRASEAEIGGDQPPLP